LGLYRTERAWVFDATRREPPSANGQNANLDSSQEVDLIDANGVVIGTPSAPTTTHDGFDVCAWATSCS